MTIGSSYQEILISLYSSYKLQIWKCGQWNKRDIQHMEDLTYSYF